VDVQKTDAAAFVEKIEKIVTKFWILHSRRFKFEMRS